MKDKNKFWRRFIYLGDLVYDGGSMVVYFVFRIDYFICVFGINDFYMEKWLMFFLY